MAAVAAEPDAKAIPWVPAFERGDGPFEAFAGRVLRTGVLVPAARLADAVLREGRCLVDRRRDGPGQLVGFGAGVDGQRVEGELVAVVGPMHRGDDGTAPVTVVAVQPSQIEDELLAIDRRRSGPRPGGTEAGR